MKPSKKERSKKQIADLIQQGITDLDDISNRTGLSKNRVYELRKELGLNQRQPRKKKVQATTTATTQQTTTSPAPDQTANSIPDPQEATKPTETAQKPVETSQTEQTATTNKTQPLNEKMKGYLQETNGWHKYIERKIGDKTDFEILQAIYNVRKPLLIVGDTGTGKGLPLNAEVFTPNGVKLNKDLMIGDNVCTPNGKTAKIIGIYPQGIKQIYKITFSDGTATKCDETHLWLVHSRIRNNKKYSSDKRIFETKYLYQKVNNKRNGSYLYQIDTTKPVFFKPQPVEIEPYFVGILIGDGNLTKNSGLRFSTADKEIFNHISLTIDDNDYKISKRAGKYDWGICKRKTNKQRNNKYIEALTRMGIYGLKSHQKFIPKQYLINSKEIRLAVLQGLMDTDGTVDKKTGMANFCTTSERLSTDIKFLVQSLGGLCTIKKKQTFFTYKGQKKKGRISYVCNIRMNNTKELFRLKRKKELAKDRTKYQTKRIIRKIEMVEKAETQCILIDDDEHLYLTNDFIVTHNTHCLHHYAFKKGLPLIRKNLNGGSKVDDFVGQWTPTTDGHFEWKDGVLTTFVRNGGIFVCDEINSASAEMLFFLHSILDDERKMVLVQKDGEVIKAHPDFWFVATMNPDYEGTKPLNQALQDRFLIMKFDYDTNVEKKLIKNHKLLTFADKIRKLYRAGEITNSLSTRALLDFEYFTTLLGDDIAEEICLFNKYRPEEIKPIKEVFELEINKPDPKAQSQTQPDQKPKA
jgi:hypothetical protein